jgi:23S rRNA (pseudouridine1915-N3)-methyltransferase
LGARRRGGAKGQRLKLLIAAIGRLKSGPEAEMAADYAQRCTATGRALGLGPLTIADHDAATAAGDREREADWLLKQAPAGAITVLLDERGENLPSIALAAKLAAWRDQGRPAACFWIGGPDGVSSRLQAAASRTLGFGAQTWPHKLVRAMLAEQLYRAATILAGGPYHRA